jgi:AbrB family looped-hinge helix DNA binding protein
MTFNTAKIMSKGQITLPVDLRKKLGLSTGDRVALIYESNRVVMVNPAVYAMEELQCSMEGEWEKAGIHSEEDITRLCREVRAELAAERATANESSN